MLTYNLSERGRLPMYEYLYNCIREDIKSGHLPAGTRLPSKRSFAVDNGVALITVENAYEQLLIEGYIEAKERIGYFVADIPFDSYEVASASGNLKAEISSKENCTENNLESVKRYDFSSTGNISDSFPYSIWSKLMRRVLSDKELEFSKSPEAAGVLELREAISGYLRDSKNLVVDPGCIIVGPGTEYLHSVLLQLIGRNRIVAVEDPGYKKAGLIYENNEMKVLHIPLDDEGICVDKLLDSNVRLVHVSPSHHFPTGIVMSASRRHKLLNWACSQEAYIIEDDYDSEFRFRGRPLPTLMSLDNEHVIYMNTFTGSLASSIRIAYMVLPEALMRIYRNRLSFISGTVSTFEQLTLAMFIGEGYYERHIGRMRNRYRKLRDRYKGALEASKLRGCATIEEDFAGLHLILKISNPKNKEWADEDLLEKLEKQGIYITPLKNYCYSSPDKYAHRFVLHYLELEKDTVKGIYNSIFESLV